jgi:hypothetical protein
VKIIPFGIPAARVMDVERKAQEYAPIISVRPLKPSSVGLILSGPESSYSRLKRDFEPPTRQRIEKLSGRLDAVQCCCRHLPAA